MPTNAIIIIVIGLVVLLALPPFLDGAIKKKNKRKSAKILCRIFGWLFILLGAYKAIESLLMQ